MALITCLECGKEVSSRATVCPHCGYPMKKVAAKKLMLIITVAVVAVAAIACIFTAKEQTNPFGQLEIDDLSRESVHAILGEPGEAHEVISYEYGFSDTYRIDEFFGAEELNITYDKEDEMAYALVSWPSGYWRDISSKEAEKKIEDILDYFEKAYGKSFNEQMIEADKGAAALYETSPFITWVIDNKFEVKVSITDLENQTTDDRLLRVSGISFQPISEVTLSLIENFLTHK